MSHHTFETADSVLCRYIEADADNAMAANTGSHCEHMSLDRFYRFAEHCSNAAMNSEVSYLATFIAGTVCDWEYDEAKREWKPTNERTPFIRIACSASSARMTKHGKHWLTDRPMRMADDALRAKNVRLIEYDGASYSMNAQLKAGRRGSRNVALHYADLHKVERQHIAMSRFRAHGHNASSLRYLNDAIRSATIEDDALAVAVFVAILTAGDWAIIKPKPRAKVSGYMRRNGIASPCDGLEQWIADPYKAIVAKMPADMVHNHIGHYLRDYDTDGNDAPRYDAERSERIRRNREAERNDAMSLGNVPAPIARKDRRKEHTQSFADTVTAYIRSHMDEDDNAIAERFNTTARYVASQRRNAL